MNAEILYSAFAALFVMNIILPFLSALITDIGDASVEMLFASSGRSIAIHVFAESSVRKSLFNAQSKIKPLEGEINKIAQMSETPSGSFG